MPCIVENGHRNAPIDARDSGRQPLAVEAILPGTGKSRELQRRCGPRCKHLCERPHELVRVLADAAALAKRRPVVDQDAHLFKSFRISILF